MSDDLDADPGQEPAAPAGAERPRTPDPETYAASARAAEDLARRAATASERQVLEKIAALWKRLARGARPDGGG